MVSSPKLPIRRKPNGGSGGKIHHHRHHADQAPGRRVHYYRGGSVGHIEILNIPTHSVPLLPVRM